MGVPGLLQRVVVQREAGVLPDTKILTEMSAFNEALVKAGAAEVREQEDRRRAASVAAAKGRG